MLYNRTGTQSGSSKLKPWTSGSQLWLQVISGWGDLKGQPLAWDLPSEILI